MKAVQAIETRDGARIVRIVANSQLVEVRIEPDEWTKEKDSENPEKEFASAGP